jgi:hypothetical protein
LRKFAGFKRRWHLSRACRRGDMADTDAVIPPMWIGPPLRCVGFLPLSFLLILLLPPPRPVSGGFEAPVRRFAWSAVPTPARSPVSRQLLPVHLLPARRNFPARSESDSNRTDLIASSE